MTTIGILGGAGALGGALAARLASAGHQVWIGSRDAEKGRAFARDVASAAGGRHVNGGDNRTCAAEAELCFLTVPYAAQADTLEQ